MNQSRFTAISFVATTLLAILLSLGSASAAQANVEELINRRSVDSMTLQTSDSLSRKEGFIEN
jgi:hypothetical protein